MIYRATTDLEPRDITPPTTLRVPRNVPYLIDNLWEWLRPEDFPSRRQSAFASPSPQAALATLDNAEARVWTVAFLDDQPACQIVSGGDPSDARYHPDIERLSRLVILRLNAAGWLGAPTAAMSPAAALFLPIANPDLVELALAEAALFGPGFREEVRRLSTFWRDCRLFTPQHDGPPPHPCGEIFFSGRYRLDWSLTFA